MIKKILFLISLIAFHGELLSAMTLNDEPIFNKLNLSDHKFLALINSCYPEMLRLTEPVRSSPESAMVTNDHSPSKKLFGKQYIEYDRTAVGILALKWVLTNNYDQLVTGQPEAIKLKRESFDSLRESTLGLMRKNALNALVTSLAFNDLGKVISFVEIVERRAGNRDVDHDNVLLTALHKFPDLVPSFRELNNDEQQIILKSMGSQFNLGQFMQAENLPANLKGLQKLSLDELEFANFHTLFDIAGARGHVSSQGALVLTEPTYQAFSMALNALAAIPRIADDCPLIVVYDYYLRMRMIKLCDKKYPINNTPEACALSRLACMMRCDNADQFTQLKETFGELSENTQTLIINELYKTGINDYGILLYYAPAVLVNALSACKQNPKAGLKIALNYLAELFGLARAQIHQSKKNGVYTVNCAALAEKMKTPAALSQYSMELQAVGDNAQVVLKLLTK